MKMVVRLPSNNNVCTGCTIYYDFRNPKLYIALQEFVRTIKEFFFIQVQFNSIYDIQPISNKMAYTLSLQYVSLIP